MHDVLSNGVKFRSFNVIDDFNRECLNLTLDTSINSQRVIRELDKLIAGAECPAEYAWTTVQNTSLMLWQNGQKNEV